MSTGILAAYVAIAVLAALNTLRRLFTSQPRRDRRPDGLDRTFLVLVALLASAAWALFVPFYVVGWLHSSGPRRALSRVAGWATLARTRLWALAKALRWAH